MSILAKLPAPVDYLELVLCRDIYHCSYTELLKQPLDKALRHLACLDGENKALEHERQKAEQKARMKM